MIKCNIHKIDEEIEKIAFIEIKEFRLIEKLSALYNARQCLLGLLTTKTNNYTDISKQKQINANTTVTDELNDILPALKDYQQAKADFTQHKITQEGVNHALRRLVVEINEFITVLYSNTTAPEEREILSDLKT